MTGRYIFPNVIRFILVLLLQVFILNNINLFGWAAPMVYPFLIILLPIGVPVSIVLLSAFFAGYTVDFWSNGGAIHAASLVGMAFLRKPLLRQLMPQSGYEKDELPTFVNQGIGWFFIYSGILLGCHHLFYFILEAYTFHNFGITLIRVILSGVVSLILYWMVSLSALPSRKKQR